MTPSPTNLDPGDRRTPGAPDSPWPSGPFTREDLAAAGLPGSALRTGLRRGEIRAVFRGVFVDASAEDTLALRALSAAKVIRPHHVASDRTAAWLHGIDTLASQELDRPPPIETCALRGHEPTAVTGVDGRTRDLTEDDIMSVHGVLVTRPLRTALDLGCNLRRREAYAALNAFARKFGLTRDDYLRSLSRYRRRRGVVQLRELVALVDPRVESERESWVLLEIASAGLPLPEPQWWIEIDGVPTYRLDFAYPHLKVCVEYDGVDAHDCSEEQRERDAVRRRWLRDQGWTIIVLRSGAFTGDQLAAWLRELADALREAELASYSNRRW